MTRRLSRSRRRSLETSAASSGQMKSNATRQPASWPNATTPGSVRHATARASPNGINPASTHCDRPPGWSRSRIYLFPVENSHSPSLGNCELVLFDCLHNTREEANSFATHPAYRNRLPISCRSIAIRADLVSVT
jgi:hypothetical protein